MKLFCLILILACGSALGARPNIILIMSDDQGYGDLGCYGSTTVHTPHLDQMAAEGMRFTNAYSGSCVCAPTRCVLMTGMHPGHARRRDNVAKANWDQPGRPLVPLAETDVTISSVLKKAGYATGGYGKWGLGNPGTTGVPEQHGFDDFFGYYDQMHAHSYYPGYLVRNSVEVPLPGNANQQRTQYSHDVLAAASLEFIKEHKNDPFFLYLPYCLPHGAYEVPDASAYADRPWSQTVKNYAAMITHMDKDIGALMALLKTLNIDERTLVIFTGDNGPNSPFIKDLKSAGPFRGVKRDLLEGGIRTPMIVRWPGKVPAGVVSEYVWGHVDIFATACDVAGLTAPQTDGHSVLPTIRGQEQAARPWMYWEFYSGFQQAVRMGNWKGIRYGTEEPLRLYALDADPRESANVAVQHPEVVSEIEKIMAREHVPSPYWPAKAKQHKTSTKKKKKTT